MAAKKQTKSVAKMTTKTAPKAAVKKDSPKPKVAAKPVAKKIEKPAPKPAAKMTKNLPKVESKSKVAPPLKKGVVEKNTDKKTSAKIIETAPVPEQKKIMPVKNPVAEKASPKTAPAPVKSSKAKKTEEEKNKPSAEMGITTGQKGSVEKIVKKMIARGKERGCITYDELNNALPAEEFSSDQIEDAMTAISDAGVQMVDSADESGEEEEKPEAKNEEEYESGGNISSDDTGRTDDPVRMYLR
ncbi:MAG: RNA polymerase sigma factor region1.1 domain-containing protein, partial [Pseudomonadota bacterium]